MKLTVPKLGNIKDLCEAIHKLTDIPAANVSNIINIFVLHYIC